MSRLDDFLEHEQHWHSNEKREQRQLRKLAQRTDRSKYRKSDMDAAAKREPTADANLNNELCRGRVVEIRAGDIFVHCLNQDMKENQLHLCHIKGSFKSERSRTKNLVAVGDLVLYQPPEATQAGQIQQILPRFSILSRADNLNHAKEQIIAANIELLVIVFALCEPILSPNLIDRYLIAAARGHLKPILVISKLDLLDAPHIPDSTRESERAKLLWCQRTYSELQVPIVTYRQDSPSSISPLENLLKGHTCVVSGPSGVGKSTLLSLLTGENLRVQPVCLRTGKGSHTTSHAQLIPLQVGGWCVDTPGIRSFGLWQLDRQSVDHYFEEISKTATYCKFRDCQHIKEPGCAVIEAVNLGVITSERYESYLNLIQELSDKHLRR